MTKTKQKNLDIKQAYESFFLIPDWKKRVALVAVAYVALIIFSIISVILMFVPFTMVFGIILYILIIISSFAANMYILGYDAELIEANAKNENISEIPFLSFTKERWLKALHLFVGWLCYLLPVIILMVITMIAVMIPTFAFVKQAQSVATYNNNMMQYNASISNQDINQNLIALSLLANIPMLLAFAYEIIFAVFVPPVLFRQYYKNQSIRSFFDFAEIWEFIKRNIINILILSAIMIGLSIIFYIVFLVTALLVFLIIGLVLLPLAFGFFILFSNHIYSVLVSQIIKIDNESSK